MFEARCVYVCKIATTRSLRYLARLLVATFECLTVAVTCVLVWLASSSLCLQPYSLPIIMALIPVSSRSLADSLAYCYTRFGVMSHLGLQWILLRINTSRTCLCISVCNSCRFSRLSLPGPLFTQLFARPVSVQTPVQTERRVIHLYNQTQRQRTLEGMDSPSSLRPPRGIPLMRSPALPPFPTRRSFYLGTRQRSSISCTAFISPFYY